MRLKENEIESFEEKLGFHLPQELRRFFQVYNGCEIRECPFSKEGKGLDVDRIFPLNGGHMSLEAIYEKDRRYHVTVPEMIPFAYSTSSGFFYWNAKTEHVYVTNYDGPDDFQFICTGMETFLEILNHTCEMQDENTYDITEISRRDAEMAKVDFLPLGSVVILKGGVQKLMIIGRGLNVKQGDDTYFFDYGGVLYPQGLTGDEMAYFNHDGVARVIAYGYMDDDSAIVDENLNTYLEEHPNLKRADPAKWNA